MWLWTNDNRYDLSQRLPDTERVKRVPLESFSSAARHGKHHGVHVFPPAADLVTRRFGSTLRTWDSRAQTAAGHANYTQGLGRGKSDGFQTHPPCRLIGRFPARPDLQVRTRRRWTRVSMLRYQARDEFPRALLPIPASLRRRRRGLPRGRPRPPGSPRSVPVQYSTGIFSLVKFGNHDDGA